MKMNAKRKIAEIQTMTASQLRREYARIFGEETRSGNRQWLFRRLAWRLQSLAEGDLSQRARQQAEQLARDQDIRVIPPGGMDMTHLENSLDLTLEAPKHILRNRDPRLPMPGVVLKRKYKGRTHTVQVLASGFEYDGEFYRSLSAIAHAITGSQWNGFLFFRLTKSRKESQ